MNFPCLQLNVEKIFEDYMKSVTDVVTDIVREMGKYHDNLNNARDGHFSKGSGNYEITPADVQDDIVHAQIEYFAYAIINSFGRGVNTSQTDEIYKKYMADKRLWNNPNRKSKVVVGRPKGTYTDFFGKTVTTKGSMDGKTMSPKLDFKGTGAISDTEFEFVYGHKSEELLKEHFESFIKQINQNPTAYFTYNEGGI